MTIRQTVKQELFDRFFQRQRLYVLNFHIISADGEDGPPDFGTRTPVDLFRRNIEALAKRHRFVDLHTWWTDLALRSSAGHAVAITFDDGHRSVFDLALPILEEFGVPATLFVNSAYWSDQRRICWSNAEGGEKTVVEGSEMTATEAIRIARLTDDADIYRAYANAIEESAKKRGLVGADYLSLDDLRAESSDLVRIGMHGHWHHRHIMFDRTWQADNIRINKEILDGLQNFVPLFAFPFGTSADLDAASIMICEELGVIPVVHNGGYNTSPSATIRRIPADGRDAIALVAGQSPFLRKYDTVHR